MESFSREIDNAKHVVSETKNDLQGDATEVGSGDECDGGDWSYWREKRNYLDVLTKNLCDF